MNKNYLKIIKFVIILLITFQTIIGMNIKSFTNPKGFQQNIIDYYDDFDENITYYMIQGNMPSVSACIIKNNSVVWKKGYGYSNIYKKYRATENTIYLGASISKTITATALLQLWEKDLFDLDDDVNKYLSFPLRNPNYPKINITIRMLLAHHSSLSYGLYSSFIYFSFIGLSSEWIKEYLIPSGKIYNSRYWIDFPPGERLEYSNIGYLILEYLVELLSNQSFEDYCKNNIFKPLEMNNTSFHVRNYKKNELAKPYIWFLNKFIPLPDYEIKNKGVAGIRTSVLDLSHFLIAHMNNGTFNDKRILQEETLQLIRKIQFSNSKQSPFDMYGLGDPVGEYGYGLGWRIYIHNNTYNIGHPGATPGTATYLTYDPFKKTGIIFFTNQYPIFIEYDFKSWLNILWLLNEKANQF